METCLKKIAILARLSPGVMGGALLAILVIVSSVHAGWLLEDQKLTASDAVEGDEFGVRVAISGEIAVISAPADGENGYRYGSVYVFIRDAQRQWVQHQKLTASDATPEDWFGNSVAIHGNTIVVGSPFHDEKGEASGSAYVFTVDDKGYWSQQAKLIASDGAEGDEFGCSIALSRDMIVVGAPYDDERVKNSGSAYVFLRDDENHWIQQSKLTTLDTDENDGLGSSIAIFGGMIVIGAPHTGSDVFGQFGSAYVFVSDGEGEWSQQAMLKAPSVNEFNGFGRSVAISESTIVVGAPYGGIIVGDSEIVDISGSAYVFKNDGQGNWRPDAKLTVSNTVGSENRFGSNVALVDGTIAVGASGDNFSAGAVYIFTNDDQVHWNQQTKLIASDAARDDRFGGSVAISGDSVLVGAADNDAEGSGNTGDDSGSAYVFTYNRSCDVTYTLPSNQWSQISLPCDPGGNNTVNAVFGDDIPGTYGRDWFVYRYDANDYSMLSDTDILSQGTAYWIVHWSGSDAPLDMPDNSTPAPVTGPAGCLDTAKGCFEIPLATQANTVQWNMVGYPFAVSGGFSNVRIQTDTGICASGCDLHTAQSKGIVYNQFWSFNGTSFTQIDSSRNLDSWRGYWAATLQNADGLNPRLLVPKP